MRKLTFTLIALSLLSMISIGVYGYDKDLKEHITLPNDVMVGNTTVKKGDYLVKYNAATSEVSIMEGKKVVATTMATVKLNDKKAESDALYTKMTPEGEKLIGLRLGGQREELTFSEPIAFEPIVIMPTVDIELNQEVAPTCVWEVIPITDDMEDMVVGEIDGVLPDAEITNYKLVCQPW